MKLVSSWGDYYDWAFDGQGEVFERIGGNTGPPKREQFRLLEEAGYMVPKHGLVADVLGSWSDSELRWIKWVVAYEDEMAHCTEGKRLFSEDSLKSNPHMGMPGGDRYHKERQLYCSEFIGDPLAKGNSLRLLQVGPHVFWLEYTSNESWMSNYGDGDIEVVGVYLNSGYHHKINLPLFAVDFVIGKWMYAVDFNSAPGLRGTGVERYLKGPEVVAAFEDWLVNRKER